MFGIRKRLGLAKNAVSPAAAGPESAPAAPTHVTTAPKSPSAHQDSEIRAPHPDSYTRYYDALIFDPLIRTYYGDYQFYNVGYWSDETTKQAEASTELLDRLLSHAPSDRTAILDVGCGLGATTAQIKRRWPAATVTGINISETQLERCRENAPDCEFECMDATRLEFADASFDLIVSVEAVFHFDTRRDFLSEAYRVLKPGGMLLVADILFYGGASADAIAVWSVAQSNALPNLQAYENVLAEAGYQGILTEDITERSWISWCRNLMTWLEDQHTQGIVTDAVWQTWQKSMPSLSTAVMHYLLAVARKP